jgi:hypothetical protein
LAQLAESLGILFCSDFAVGPLTIRLWFVLRGRQVLFAEKKKRTFFFEKKKQKTFVVAAGTTSGRSDMMPDEISKSFASYFQKRSFSVSNLTRVEFWASFTSSAIANGLVRKPISSFAKCLRWAASA